MNKIEGGKSKIDYHPLITPNIDALVKKKGNMIFSRE